MFTQWLPFIFLEVFFNDRGSKLFIYFFFLIFDSFLKTLSHQILYKSLDIFFIR